MYDKQRYSPNIYFTFFILFVNKTELYIELYIGKVALWLSTTLVLSEVPILNTSLGKRWAFHPFNRSHFFSEKCK